MTPRRPNRRDVLKKASVAPLAMLAGGGAAIAATARTPRVHEVDELDVLASRLPGTIEQVENLEWCVEWQRINEPKVPTDRVEAVRDDAARYLASIKARMVQIMRERSLSAVRHGSRLFVDGTAPPLGIDTSGLIVVRLDD